jgi:succinate dehydrogenase/fumarate reductase cytochrome b subunit
MGALNNAVSFVFQTLSYKGRAGHWAWILHRAAGIGVFIFLSLHIFDIFLVGFGPEVFNALAVIYHHPLIRIGHIFLFLACYFMLLTASAWSFWTFGHTCGNMNAGRCGWWR